MSLSNANSMKILYIGVVFSICKISFHAGELHENLVIIPNKNKITRQSKDCPMAGTDLQLLHSKGGGDNSESVKSSWVDESTVELDHMELGLNSHGVLTRP